MFAISFTISKIFAVEMSITLTLTFRMGQGYCKYANRDFLFDDNNVFLFVNISKKFAVKLHVLTMTFKMGQGQIESPHMTCYLMSIVIFTLSVTVSMLLTVEINTTFDLDL